MSPGYQALTEKEKAALRLLVSGYDAKTTATELGLSVHTVNERLRDARRKLSVSSSREAARLVHAVEREHPEFLGDKPLGDAPTAQLMPSQTSPDARSHISLRFSSVIGGVSMSIMLAMFAYGSLSDDARTPTTGSPLVAVSKKPVETAPVQATRQWLALVDAGHWQTSWQATGESFRKLNTVELWTSVSLKVRTPLGSVVSRHLLSEEDVPTPPNGNIVIKFQTSFATKAGARETLALSREDNSWKVVGYYIE